MIRWRFFPPHLIFGLAISFVQSQKCMLTVIWYSFNMSVNMSEMSSGSLLCKKAHLVPRMLLINKHLNTLGCWKIPQKQLCSPSSIIQKIFPVSIWCAERMSRPVLILPCFQLWWVHSLITLFITVVTQESPVKTITYVLWCEAYCHRRKIKV